MDIVSGKPDLYNLLVNTNMVHVDDLVRAHIFLLEYPNAQGRYMCSSDVITIEEMSEFLSTNYPELSIPTVE